MAVTPQAQSHHGLSCGLCDPDAAWVPTGVCDVRGHRVIMVVSCLLCLLIIGLEENHLTSLSLLLHQCNLMIIMKAEALTRLLGNTHFKKKKRKEKQNLWQGAKQSHRVIKVS